MFGIFEYKNYRMLRLEYEQINVFTNGRSINVAAVLLTESKLGPLNTAC